MIVLGSNLYEMSFSDDLYLYNSDRGLQLKQGIMISPKKLELPPIAIQRSDRGLIAWRIVQAAIKQLDYLVVDDLILNPFEFQCIRGCRSMPGLKLSLVDGDSPCLQMDVRRIGFSLQSCAEIQTDLVGKYVRTRYATKEFRFKVKAVIHNQEIMYKGQTLQQYIEKKYKLKSTSELYIETENTSKVTKQFLLADLCEIEVDVDEADCGTYCENLLYWNDILNYSENFIQYLKDYKLVLHGRPKCNSVKILNPGTMVLANKTYKPLSNVVYARTISEFDYFYSEVFLKQNQALTTNLQIKLKIFAHTQSLNEKNNVGRFIELLDQFIKTRSYGIQYTIVDVIDDLTMDDVSEYSLIVGDASFIEKNAFCRTQMLNKGIGCQLITVPILEAGVNRLLGVIAANIGSAPWQLREIDGRFGEFKISSILGIHNDSYVMSINKTFSKHISTKGNSDDAIYQLLGTFFQTHKSFMDLLIVISDQVIDISNQIKEVAAKLNQQQPTVYYITSKQQRSFRYFTHQENDFKPYFCKNPQIGTIIGDHIHSERVGQGAPYAQEVKALNVPDKYQKDIIQLYYQLVFLCFDLNSRTYLPSVQYYAQILSRTTIQSKEFMTAIQRGQLLYI